jgi:hypothetical protein
VAALNGCTSTPRTGCAYTRFLRFDSVWRYEDAAHAARKSVQSNPGFSIPHICLASALVKLGRIDEAKAAAARVLALHPEFSIGEWCASIDPAPEIAAPLTEALRGAGLPA